MDTKLRNTTPRRFVRRIIWVLAIAFVMLIVAAIVVFEFYLPQKMNRYYAFGAYGRAYYLCCFEKGMKSPTLAEIERINNDWESLRRAIIPVSPDHRPIYRPIDAESNELFLIFVEALPDNAWFDDRFVIFATPDGCTHSLEWLDSAALVNALIADDELRWSIQSSASR